MFGAFKRIFGDFPNNFGGFQTFLSLWQPVLPKTVKFHNSSDFLTLIARKFGSL